MVDFKSDRERYKVTCHSAIWYLSLAENYFLRWNVSLGKVDQFWAIFGFQVKEIEIFEIDLLKWLRFLGSIFWNDWDFWDRFLGHRCFGFSFYEVFYMWRISNFLWLIYVLWAVSFVAEKLSSELEIFGPLFNSEVVGPHQSEVWLTLPPLPEQNWFKTVKRKAKKVYLFELQDTFISATLVDSSVCVIPLSISFLLNRFPSSPPAPPP